MDDKALLEFVAAQLPMLPHIQDALKGLSAKLEKQEKRLADAVVCADELAAAEAELAKLRSKE